MTACEDAHNYPLLLNYENELGITSFNQKVIVLVKTRII